MRPAPVLLLPVLAGCMSATPGFFEAPSQVARVERYVFDVRVRTDRAEVVRINPIWPPPAGETVVLAAGLAIEAVSGCALRAGSLRGDAAMQTAQLACSGANLPPPLPRSSPQVTCTVDPAALVVGPTGVVDGMECDILGQPVFMEARAGLWPPV